MRIFVLVFSILFLFQCGSGPDEVETIFQEGVEVVLNHLEPYRIPGEPVSFTLSEEFSLDFEREDLAELGIGTIRGFDADSRGCIYMLSEQRIFIFDDRGKFIKKFGRNGQGPGEYTRPAKGRLLDSGELVLYDGGNDKFLFYSPEGEFLREIKNSSNIQVFGGSGVDYLNEFCFLFEEINFDLEQDELAVHLSLVDSGFEKIADLREWATKENPYRSNRYNLFDAYIKYQVFQDKIYVINQANPDFEINIYDFQGKNTKRIKKEYRKVKITEGFKQTALDSYKDSQIADLIKTKGYFPDYYPPIKDFHIDGRGRILCESYEEGKDSNEVKMYIFSSEGVFIGTQYLAKALGRRFKNNRLYALFEKENGFQRLAVHKVGEVSN